MIFRGESLCYWELRIRHFSSNKIILLGDEKYSFHSDYEIKGSSKFYTDDFDNTSDNSEYGEGAKFEDEILVWCIILPASV